MAEIVWGLDVEAELGLVDVEAELGLLVDGVEQLHASAARATNAIPKPFTQGTIASRSSYQGAAWLRSAVPGQA